MRTLRWAVLIALLVLLVACGARGPEVLRLATTTSTADSGLLDAILPAFEEEYNARVDVVAVGTGQAISLGEAGDADVILVHARPREDAFVADGHGLYRADVMYNDFVLVGPTDDPAGVSGLASVTEAMTTLAAASTPFASRGDDSGTHSKELSLWAKTTVTPAPDNGWYNSLGQGMGDTLTFANEVGAYTFTDRATFLAQQANLPNLAIMVGGASIADNADPDLLNPYGVIPVNPDKEGINDDLAEDFVTWITSAETQTAIGEFGVEQYGQPLFYPNADGE